MNFSVFRFFFVSSSLQRDSLSQRGRRAPAAWLVSSLGCIFRLLLLSLLHCLDHRQLLGLLLLVPGLKLQPRNKQEWKIPRKTTQKRPKRMISFSLDLFSMILWTMSSVVRLFPLSMVLKIPLSFGSWEVMEHTGFINIIT